MSTRASQNYIYVRTTAEENFVAEDIQWNQLEAIRLDFSAYRNHKRIPMPTGGSCLMEAWVSGDMATLYINKTGTVDTATDKATVELTKAQANLTAGSYKYSLKVLDADDTELGVIATGDLTVVASVNSDEVSYVGTSAVFAIETASTTETNTDLRLAPDGSGGVEFIAGGSGHTIQEEGVDLATRTNLNFIGPAVTAADDAGNDATNVTIDVSDKLNLSGGTLTGTLVLDNIQAVDATNGVTLLDSAGNPVIDLSGLLSSGVTFNRNLAAGTGSTYTVGESGTNWLSSFIETMNGNTFKALTSGGGTLKSSNGTTCLTFGSGGGANLTTADGLSVGGTLTLTTDLAVTHGGTGASDASGARTNLGLVIGTDVLAPSGDGSNLTGLPKPEVRISPNDFQGPLATGATDDCGYVTGEIDNGTYHINGVGVDTAETTQQGRRYVAVVDVPESWTAYATTECFRFVVWAESTTSTNCKYDLEITRTTSIGGSETTVYSATNQTFSSASVPEEISLDLADLSDTTLADRLVITFTLYTNNDFATYVAGGVVRGA